MGGGFVFLELLTNEKTASTCTGGLYLTGGSMDLANMWVIWSLSLLVAALQVRFGIPLRMRLLDMNKWITVPPFNEEVRVCKVSK